MTGRANRDNRYHLYLSPILFVWTGVPGRCHHGKPTDYFQKTTGQILLSKMSMYLAELIFPSTSVIVPTHLQALHQNITDTQVLSLQLPHSQALLIPLFLRFSSHIHM